MSDSTLTDGVLTLRRSTSEARALALALGTFLRRTGAVGRFVLSSDDAAFAPVRDGLVQGLVLTGIDVIDIDVADRDAARAVCVAIDARGHVHIGATDAGADRDRATLFVIVGGEALLPAEMARVGAILERGDFASGEGVLTVTTIADVQRVPRALSAATITTTARLKASAVHEPTPQESTGRVRRAGPLDEDTWVDG
jgi:hypothetical protein